MAPHAVLSASASKRWLACPPSARLEGQFPDEKSDYAAEGSFAHELAECKLKSYISMCHSQQQYEELKMNPFFSTELESYVDDYVDFVKERIHSAFSRTKDAVILLEQKLDFSPWVPEGFGTGDVVLIADDYIEVIDLKFGKGVPVAAEDNTQMQLYALGAINDYGMLYDIQSVQMTICQPRLDSISTQEKNVDELLEWAEEEVKPIAEIAFAGEGEFCAGDHCRFCRARCTCKARADYNLEMAKYDFREPALLADAEIGEILARAEELQKWAKDVHEYAFDQAANHGKKWTGWKLVEGRSNRKYMDEKAVIDALLAAGYTEDAIYTQPTLQGVSALEKNLSKKTFNRLLGGLIVKPPGKPTLVPEADKRPEINSADSAVADFSNVI